VWRREPSRLERLAGRLLRSPGLARALVSTPSLLLPWVIASVVVLGLGALTTLGTGEPLVALLAPAVAGAGIAYAYGPGIDPAWELSLSMAVSDRMVLLARALGVFAVYALLGLAACAGPDWRRGASRCSRGRRPPGISRSSSATSRCSSTTWPAPLSAQRSPSRPLGCPEENRDERLHP
jgi:hypothetical protein